MELEEDIIDMMEPDYKGNDLLEDSGMNCGSPRGQVGQQASPCTSRRSFAYAAPYFLRSCQILLILVEAV